MSNSFKIIDDAVLVEAHWDASDPAGGRGTVTWRLCASGETVEQKLVSIEEWNKVGIIFAVQTDGTIYVK